MDSSDDYVQAAQAANLQDTEKKLAIRTLGRTRGPMLADFESLLDRKFGRIRLGLDEWEPTLRMLRNRLHRMMRTAP